MTIPCKSVLHFAQIEALRPEGLDVEKRRVLFPYRTRPKRRVFFCLRERCISAKKGAADD